MGSMSAHSPLVVVIRFISQFSFLVLISFSFHLKSILFLFLQKLLLEPFMDLVFLTNLLTPENQKPPR